LTPYWITRARGIKANAALETSKRANHGKGVLKIALANAEEQMINQARWQGLL
jgi:hypothetical protein